MRAKLLHVTVTYTVHPMFFFPGSGSARSNRSKSRRTRRKQCFGTGYNPTWYGLIYHSVLYLKANKIISLITLISHALFKMIVYAGTNPQSTTPGLNDLLGSSGWELALVTTPSNNTSTVLDSQLVLSSFSFLFG